MSGYYAKWFVIYSLGREQKYWTGSAWAARGKPYDAEADARAASVDADAAKPADATLRVERVTFLDKRAEQGALPLAPAPFSVIHGGTPPNP